MGAFYPFIDIKETRLIGVEAGGEGVETGEHAAPLNDGMPGVLHGALSYLMQDDSGQLRLQNLFQQGLIILVSVLNILGLKTLEELNMLLLATMRLSKPSMKFQNLKA